MPWKPKRPCRHPGCPSLSDQPYCEVHRKAVKAESTRAYNENIRDKEAQKFYDSPAWRKLRAIKIKQNPICEECYRQGRMTSAQVVDHILPMSEYPDKRLEIENLQSLCWSCHTKKTNRERAQPKGDEEVYRF